MNKNRIFRALVFVLTAGFYFYAMAKETLRREAIQPAHQTLFPDWLYGVLCQPFGRLGFHPASALFLNSVFWGLIVSLLFWFCSRKKAAQVGS